MANPESMGFTLPADNEYMKNGAKAIRDNAQAAADNIEKTRYKRGTIPANADLNDYYGAGVDGVYACLSGSIAATLKNLPPELAESPVGFVLDVRTMGAGVVQDIDIYSVWEVVKYSRTSAPSTGDGWSRWRRVLLDGDVPEPETGGTPASGYKILPLILTAGRGGDEDKAPLSATVEYDVNLSPAINTGRFRFGLRDGNPRWGTFTAQAIRLSNISVAGVSKLSGMTTNADGSITFSPWMSGALGNLKFDYTAPIAPRYIIGGGRVNGTRRTEMPFELWLEVEVPATTPAIGLVGDSNSVGVNTTIPIHDAWMSQYCRRMGYFPVLYGHSGDGMSQAQTIAHYKWNRWNHLDRPDVVVHANGANDIPNTEGGLTLAQMQAWARAEWEISDAKISKNKHGAVIKSRSSGINNTVRVQYNNWIKSLPTPLRDWHDIASPVTVNDAGGTLPQYVSSDGIHMTTAGQKAIADSITRPLVPASSALTVKQDVGRVITAWDYLNNREQMIYGDTGERDVSELVNPYLSGIAKLSRSGNWVQLEFDALIFQAAAANFVQVANLLPSGFRPNSSYQYFNTVSRTSLENVSAVRISKAGGITVYGLLANEPQFGVFVWRTSEPWPSSLPGKPA